MSLSYSASIPTGNQFLRFLNLLLRWRGSVYKLVWKDLLLYLFLYYVLNLAYRFGMNDNVKTRFEDFVVYISSWKSKSLPITFLLGFFVSQILSRWWVMFNAIPTMDSPAYHLNALIMTKADPIAARRVRLTAMRYLNLAWILALRNLSTQVRKRFQLSKARLRQIGYKQEEKLMEELQLINSDKQIGKHFATMLTKSELTTMIEVTKRSEHTHRYQPDWYLPLQWCSRLLKKATIHGFVENERNYLALVAMVDSFERRLQKLRIYSQFNLPLVYSQVVIISVYSYLIMHIFDHQFLNTARAANRTLGAQYNFDYYIPLLGILEFLFVMGWLKVALVLLNPLGSDDEDFPTSDLLDYNVSVSRYLAGNYSLAFPPKLRERQCQETKTDLNIDASFDEVLDSDGDSVNDDMRVCLKRKTLLDMQEPSSESNGGFVPDASGNLRSFTLAPAEF